ncbi:hypothetical protein OHB00_06880 [Streptomyces sp. NBC_00631]|uniref:hypothetical protein n=1 Tax=Streptomyces sp. NBC_00631 TaxID=2975793 RepID=UPI0030E2C219
MDKARWSDHPLSVPGPVFCPKAGETFEVEVPTYVSALVHFEGGASAHSLYSFESPHTRYGFVEISGTEATLRLPDPNYFDGVM